MRETDIGHRRRILENDIEIDRKHLPGTINALARINQPLIQDLYPVNNPGAVARKSGHGIVWLLQVLDGNITGIMDTVIFNINDVLSVENAGLWTNCKKGLSCSVLSAAHNEVVNSASDTTNNIPIARLFINITHTRNENH